VHKNYQDQLYFTEVLEKYNGEVFLDNGVHLLSNYINVVSVNNLKHICFPYSILLLTSLVTVFTY